MIDERKEGKGEGGREEERSVVQKYTHIIDAQVYEMNMRVCQCMLQPSPPQTCQGLHVYLKVGKDVNVLFKDLVVEVDGTGSTPCLLAESNSGREGGRYQLERCPHFRGCYVQASMELGPEDVSLLERCPHFRGCYVQASMELGPEDVSLLERCPHFRGCYVQASMELGPEDVSLLERCPHFRGCYVQASMELGPEDVSLLERCPHFRGCYVQAWDLKMCPY